MGLFPGKEKMPVEPKLYNRLLEEFKFDPKYALKCVEDNRHNHITACYHLIEKRNKKIKDRQENYSLTKIDFKKKMRMGTNIKDVADTANKTTTDNKEKVVADIKKDLNMTAPVAEHLKGDRNIMNDFSTQPQTIKQRDTSVNYNTIQSNGNENYSNTNERIAAYQRRAQTRGNYGQPAGDSQSPDKYTINKNLVVNLNDSIVKPVKRENSNATNHTYITGVTASTAITGGSHAQQMKQNAFYQTQYRAGGKVGFFPSSMDNGPKVYSDKTKMRQ